MEIDYQTFLKMKNIEVIDLRDNQRNKLKYFDKIKYIPFTKLIIEPFKYLRKENSYLLVCEHGIKSKKTSEILNRQGYHTYSLKNGINNINL